MSPTFLRFRILLFHVGYRLLLIYRLHCAISPRHDRLWPLHDSDDYFAKTLTHSELYHLSCEILAYSSQRPVDSHSAR